MNKHKHTLEPWRVRTSDGPNAGPDHGFDVFGMCSSGMTWINPDDDETKAQANAHLIAAAPDMLEALLAARDEIEHLLDCDFNERAYFTTFEEWISDNETLPAIKAAIAKAQGGE